MAGGGWVWLGWLGVAEGGRGWLAGADIYKKVGLRGPTRRLPSKTNYSPTEGSRIRCSPSKAGYFERGSWGGGAPPQQYQVQPDRGREFKKKEAVGGAKALPHHDRLQPVQLQLA